ncbi:MAG: hypothetical protein AB1724_02765 [Thermodesulfobacteriota bacterium]
MSVRLKAIFLVLILTALIFGFLHLFVDAAPYSFQRLHIFLFNLCAGGTIILYFTQGRGTLSVSATAFLALSLTYAVLVFFHFYLPSIIVSLLLAILVERSRIRHFSLFPIGFFRRREPVSRKFHQASLLCLSIGLVFSTAVVANNEYLKLITVPKLELDVFFLGYSFPVSLITLSVIFSFLDQADRGGVRALKEVAFWAINLGVIVFFGFILLGMFSAQIIVTIILSAAVVMTFILYYRLGENIQQKNFLSSGVCFLMVTAVSGMAYILAETLPGYTPEGYHWLLKVHAFASLYGWNLCGLAVICRYDDFPIQLHSRELVLLHWVAALILAPAGVYSRAAAVVAVAAFAVLLYVILFAKRTGEGG